MPVSSNNLDPKSSVVYETRSICLSNKKSVDRASIHRTSKFNHPVQEDYAVSGLMNSIIKASRLMVPGGDNQIGPIANYDNLNNRTEVSKIPIRKLTEASPLPVSQEYAIPRRKLRMCSAENTAITNFLSGEPNKASNG